MAGQGALPGEPARRLGRAGRIHARPHFAGKTGQPRKIARWLARRGQHQVGEQALQGVYRNFGTDVVAFNGDGSWALPMPARYVIAPDGTIAYAKVNANYTHRPEPGDVCPVLEKLKAGAA